MSLGGPWLLLPLAWAPGVAGQLQQSELWPWLVYAVLALLGAQLWVLAIWRPGWRAWPISLLAGLMCAAGLTGSRAA